MALTLIILLFALGVGPVPFLAYRRVARWEAPVPPPVPEEGPGSDVEPAPVAPAEQFDSAAVEAGPVPRRRCAPRPRLQHHRPEVCREGTDARVVRMPSRRRWLGGRG